jgi:hypothetical protein
MKKFGIFLEFETSENNLINRIKSSVLIKILGQNDYFLEKPHLTIYTFTTNFPTTVISDIFKKLFNKLNIKKISYLRFKIFKNDLLTGKDTLVLLIKKEIKLLKLQKKIYNNFNNYFYFDNKNTNILSKIMLLNYKKFCFSYYGRIWLPHITIGSFNYNKNKNKILDLLDIDIPKNFKVSSITLNLISKLKTKKISTCK